MNKKESFNNHIGGSSELTMIADIKQGLVPVRESISYASRLRRHLKMLSALRKNGLETDRGGLYVGPIDALRTLQYVKWTLIEDDTKMLLSVNFDRPLEPYIRRIVDVAGPLLDTILCHCEGFHNHYSDLGSHVFAEFPAKHQVPVDLFAAAAPNFTVDDADYFTEMDAETRRGKIRVPNNPKSPSGIKYAKQNLDYFDLDAVGKSLTRPPEKLARSKKDNPGAVLHQALNIIRIMHKSQQLFPNVDNKDVVTRDDLMYYRLTEKLVPGFWDGLRLQFEKLGHTNLPSTSSKLWCKIKTLLDDPLPGGLPAEAAGKILFLRKLLKDFSEPLDWFSNRPPPRERPLLETEDNKGEFQTPISNAPKDTTHACLVFLRIDNPVTAASFLREMNHRLFPVIDPGSSHATDPAQVHWTLSITNKGIESLEISEEERLKFPAPFREGMAERAGLLGDTDQNHPNRWEWPEDLNGNAIDPTSIDLIIQMQTSAPDHRDSRDFVDNNPVRDDHPLNVAYLALKKDAESSGVVVLGLEPMQLRLLENGAASGHLEFADGISQPDFTGNADYKVIEKSPKDPTNPEEEDAVSRLGDIKLGHDNSLDRPIDFDHSTEMNRFPRFKLPLLDGTFQVIRKIEIDIDAFENINSHVDLDGAKKPDSQTVQEKMFGRKKDGQPFAEHDPEEYNNFNYENDPKGLGCPLQSHIRRANPRRHDTPRIMRRGFSYGTFDRSVPNVGRGLFFIAYNANIAEQFEVIQRWITGGSSTGIPSLHGDPLLAPVRPDGNRVFRYVDDKDEVIRVELPDRPLTSLKWGLYAFVPSREGLQTLATMAGTAQTSMSQLAVMGAKVKEKRITPLESNGTGDAWKILLEDRDHNRREEREAIWAWIRESNNGVLDTHDDDYYGVLVGSAKGVQQLFMKSDKDISVRDYWYRMKDSISPNKLGFDPDPKKMCPDDPYFKAVAKGDHAEDVRVISKFIAGLDLDKVFTDAFNETSNFLNQLPVEIQPQRIPAIDNSPNKSTRPPPRVLGRWIDLERMIDDVGAKLSALWFDLPDDSDLKLLKVGGLEDKKVPHCPQDFLNASFYVFGPTPTPTVKTRATTGFTPKLAENLSIYAKNTQTPRPDTLLDALKSAQSTDPDYWTDKKIGEALAGVTFGFVGPVPGSFISLIFDWIDQDTLWRVQQMLLADNSTLDYSNVKKVLEPLVLAGMQGSPIPDLLYRRCVEDTEIGGEVIKAGRKITFSIASALVEDPSATALLFGGDYFSKSDKPVHSCPGQRMGLSTIYGVLAALLTRGGRLRAEGPLTLRLDMEETARANGSN